MRIAIMLCGVIACGVVHAGKSDSYLCVADKATGFSFDKSQSDWTLNVPPIATLEKFLVTRSTMKNAAWTWEVKEVGQSFPQTTCKEDFDARKDLTCSGMYEFKMSKKSLRFLAAFLHGYVSDFIPDFSGLDKSPPTPVTTKEVPEGSDSPFIEIGKCSAL